LLDFTNRLTTLLANGPHTKAFGEEATKAISSWFWDVSLQINGDEKERTDEEIKNEATSLLGALKF
jgi:hypothetical protein